MDVFIAIDAGQTHTECAVVNQAGKLIGTGSSGPSYIQDGSMVVRASFDAAIAAAGVQPTDVRAVFVGVTGGQIPGRLEAVQGHLHNRFEHAVIRVVPDGEFVLRSYVGNETGGVLIAGTGSVAVGSYNGLMATVGGYGYLFGDEGAGSWIVLEYIRRSLRIADVGPWQTDLALAVCQHFGVDDLRHIPGMFYARGVIDVNAIAGAAILILRAGTDDMLAQHLVYDTSVELAGLARRLVRALDVPVTTRFPLFLVGGVWGAYTLLMPHFRTALAGDVQWTIQHAQVSPACAAVHYARRLYD